MMKRILAGIALVMILAPAVPDVVNAQRIDSPYRFLDRGQYVGILAGYVWADEGRIDNGPHPAPYLGANWGLRVSGPFAVTADVGFLSTKRTVRDTSIVASDSSFAPIGDVNMRLLTLMGGLRFNVTGPRTWHDIQPYVVMSAGVAFDVSGTQSLDTTLDPDLRFDFGTSFAGQGGIGMDWFPTSRVSVRLDARSLLWKVPIPEAFQLTATGENLPGSDWEVNIMLAAGLSIYF